MNTTDRHLVHREKFAQAASLLAEKNLDAWLILARETSQINEPSLDLILEIPLTWISAFIITRSGESVAVVGNLDKPDLELSGLFSKIVGYDQDFKPGFLAELNRLAPNSIALNYSESNSSADGLTHGLYNFLLKTLEGTPFAGRIVSAEEVVGELRGRKSSTEIALIKSSCEAAEEIFRRAGNCIRPGISEQEIFAFFKKETADAGLTVSWDPNCCPVITAGPGSAFGHTAASDLKIQAGELLVVDFGVRKNGYKSDLQRSWYLPKAGESTLPADIQKAWSDLNEAFEAGRKMLCPGVRGWQVDKVARELLIAKGYPEIKHAFGHQMGRATHDGGTLLGPKWARYGKSIEGVVRAGNVFAIEIEVPVKGRGYLSREEDVHVTEHGAEFLIPPQKEIWICK